jgi:hypothetical protein
MNPFFSKEMAQQHIGELQHEARGRYVPDGWVEDDGLTVRVATQRDGEAVRLLAALEGLAMPRGRMLVAQVCGEVVAALPLNGGPALADPFRRSAQYVELLRLRARQLRTEDERSHRSLGLWIRGVLRAA